MAGNLQQLNHVREFLWPPQPLSLFFYLSHKVGRLAAAVALPLAFGFNLLLLDHPFYRALAALQVVFYAIAGAGALRTLRPRILGLPYYFCMINLAMFWRFTVRCCRGGRSPGNSEGAPASEGHSNEYICFHERLVPRLSLG